jgi:hypothetical protein
MKRLAALLVVLLGSVGFSAADTLTLNDGEGKMFATSYDFLFFGPSRRYSGPNRPFRPFGRLARRPRSPELLFLRSSQPKFHPLLRFGNTGLM